jgi:hypothetical protein
MYGRELNGGRDRRPWSRWAAALVATLLAGSLATACRGGTSARVATGPTAATSGSTGSPSLVAYSACMRSHGVPRFPDPDGRGNYPAADPRHLGVSSTRYQAAGEACQHLLPTGASLQQQTNRCLWFGDCPPALVQQLMTMEREYARCLRAHAVPNWPDPVLNKGRPAFDLSNAGIDPDTTNSSRFMSADRTCRRQAGGSVPVVPYT